jgi:hypothetical protein
MVVSLEPVQGATGYIVSANGNPDLSIETRLAYSPFIVLDDADLGKVSDLTIATMDNDGQLGVPGPLPVIER